jgi:hypothetical protein
MPDDKTIATILAICNLMGNTRNSVKDAVEAYEKAMQEVLRYRQSKGLEELGGFDKGAA